MSYFRPHLETMKGYVPGEQPHDGEFIKLNTNENPYPPSPLVIESLIQNLNPRYLGLYPPPLCDELREKVSEVYGYPPDWILIGNGSDELLNIVFRAFLGKNDRVVYPFPTYTLYRTLALFQEADYHEIPFNPDYTLPESIFTKSACMKVICNPNSPTGTFLPSSHIEKLLKSSSCPVVVDEAYVDFARENALPLLGQFDQLIILRTLSKSFSLAGMRIGVLFAHPNLVDGFLKLKDSYNVSWFSQKAAWAALQDIQHMKQNAEKIKHTRSVFSEAMLELGYVVLPSEANFVMVKRPGKNLERVYLQLKQRKILVRYFSEWPDSLRISMGTDANMETVIGNLREIEKETGGHV